MKHIQKWVLYPYRNELWLPQIATLMDVCVEKIGLADCIVLFLAAEYNTIGVTRVFHCLNTCDVVGDNWVHYRTLMVNGQWMHVFEEPTQSISASDSARSLTFDTPDGKSFEVKVP